MMNQQKSILGNMDSLWFHEAILFSQPIGASSTISTRTDKTSINPNTSTITTSSSSLSSDDQEMIQQLDVEHQEEALTSGVSLISISQEGDFDVVTEEEDSEISVGEIPVTPTSDSNSSISTTSSTHRHQRRRRAVPRRRALLERTLSCKAFEELEEEEVKGFMDLGFNFEKNRLTPRMMSILPGLQRLQQDDDDDDDDNQEKADDETISTTDDQLSETTVEDAGESGKLKSRRPYLSESWTIERPDSPLLRMRMPTAFSAPDDMKRLLKVWVKTVAVAVRD